MYIVLMLPSCITRNKIHSNAFLPGIKNIVGKAAEVFENGSRVLQLEEILFTVLEKGEGKAEYYLGRTKSIPIQVLQYCHFIICTTTHYN